MHLPLTPEDIRIKKLLQSLGFKASSVNPRVMTDFKETQCPIEWMAIKEFSLYDAIMKKMEKEKKIPVTPSEFISETSRMKINKEDGMFVCFINIPSIGQGALLVGFDLQKELVSIFSGDGFAKCCKFAVKPVPLF